MRKFQVIVFKTIICFSLLMLVSCRDSSGQKSGTAAGEDANGDTRGTDSPADNEGSGSSPKAAPSDGNK